MYRVTCLVTCKVLGRTTARYRWFAILYLVVMFVMVPGTVLLLSLAGEGAMTITVPLLPVVPVPDHDGGRPKEINAWFLYTHMVYL